MLKILLVSFFTFLPVFHPIHISLCEINRNANNGNLEIMVKIFIDDLEDSIEKTYDAKLGLDTKKELKNADEFLEKYIRAKFDIGTNSGAFQYDYLGHDIESEAVWIYLQISDPGELNSVKIRHSVLMESFEDQKNLVNFKVNGKMKSLILHPEQPADIIQF